MILLEARQRVFVKRNHRTISSLHYVQENYRMFIQSVSQSETASRTRHSNSYSSPQTTTTHPNGHRHGQTRGRNSTVLQHCCGSPPHHHRATTTHHQRNPAPGVSALEESQPGFALLHQPAVFYPSSPNSKPPYHFLTNVWARARTWALVAADSGG